MGRSFDFLLAAIALIAGIMLLTGHGDIFLKGGDAQLRKAKYDEEKLSKGSGVALLAIGVLTGIDSYTESLAAKIIYVVLLVLIIIGLGLYVKFKCARTTDSKGKPVKKKK